MADHPSKNGWQRVVHGFETAVLRLLEVLLIVVIVLAVVSIAALLWQNGATKVGAFDTMPELQHAVLRAFSGVLLVVLGLELLETLRAYHATHHVRLQVILIVALIAVARHVMVIDFEIMDPMRVYGAGALLIALAVGYYLVERAERSATAR